jgi:hypothetical protein
MQGTHGTINITNTNTNAKTTKNDTEGYHDHGYGYNNHYRHGIYSPHSPSLYDDILYANRYQRWNPWYSGCNSLYDCPASTTPQVVVIEDQRSSEPTDNKTHNQVSTSVPGPGSQVQAPRTEHKTEINTMVLCSVVISVTAIVIVLIVKMVPGSPGSP